MGDPPAPLNPDFVYNLFTGVYKPQLVRIALVLDVFTPLASGPADVQAVAQACGSSTTGTRLLLDYLSNIGVLERRANSYSLPPATAAFFLPDKPAYVGDLVLQRTAAETVEGYLEALRSGHPYSPVRPWAQEAWLQSYASPQPALEMWRLAGIEPGRTSRLHIVDLACGCALKSLALAHADPLVQVTCVDSSEVLNVARDLAGRLGIISQVEYVPADILTFGLGVGQYGAALLGQVTHYFTPEQNIALFKRVCQSLAPHGVLVLDAPMMSETCDEWNSFGSFFIWATSAGKAHSFMEYSNWLEIAGFEVVRQLGTDWLSAQK
jgi:SAM-dependent methyltransferase